MKNYTLIVENPYHRCYVMHLKSEDANLTNVELNQYFNEARKEAVEDGFYGNSYNEIPERFLNKRGIYIESVTETDTRHVYSYPFGKSPLEKEKYVRLRCQDCVHFDEYGSCINWRVNEIKDAYPNPYDDSCSNIELYDDAMELKYDDIHIAYFDCPDNGLEMEKFLELAKEEIPKIGEILNKSDSDINRFHWDLADN